MYARTQYILSSIHAEIIDKESSVLASETTTHQTKLILSSERAPMCHREFYGSLRCIACYMLFHVTITCSKTELCFCLIFINKLIRNISINRVIIKMITYCGPQPSHVSLCSEEYQMIVLSMNM